MVYIANFIIAVFLAYFTFGIYTEIPISAHWAILVFMSWYFVLWLISYFYDKRHFVKVPQALNLLIFYIKSLFVSSFRVAYDIITPKDHMNPGILALPLEAKTDIEITLLANFITLTPGTLSLDLSEDRTILYVHDLFIDDDDLERATRTLKNDFETRLLNLTR